MRSLLSSLFLICFTKASCPARDLETVYGSWEYNFNMEDFIYAIDPLTYDMVVAGSFSYSLWTTDKPFIYMLNEF